MRDYDAIIIGGGINGLTTATYLAKAGLSVAVFEARGQCGAFCDTIELGIPGYLHNTHAQWLVPAMSPAMADLELDRFGLELLGTDVLFAKTFADGRNLVQSLDQPTTNASFSRISEHDARVQAGIFDYLAEQAVEALDLNQKLIFSAPTGALMERLATFHDGLLRSLDVPLSGADIQKMTAFEVLDHLFESEEVKTMPAALGEFTGQWPVWRGLGTQALALSSMAPMPVHTARGGSHGLTHALVKCFVAQGGDIWTTCPVDKILVRDGRAHGVRLSPDALLPGEEIQARVVVSNLTLAPTFLSMIGKEIIGSDRAKQIEGFNYDDPQLVSVSYALSDDPEFSSAAYDAEIQRSWVGYFGGDSIESMRLGMKGLLEGTLPDELMGGWFIPTRADPGQAPPGGHTMQAWFGVPPCPKRWRGQSVGGWKAWPELADPLADAAAESLERCIPGFRDLILERHVSTPMHQERGNPSAILGNMIGGSAMPSQAGVNRPLPGIVEGGASRSFIPGLYLSNSIHPFGATHLATGCIAAGEVAEDLGCRDQPWWQAPAFLWFLENMGNIPMNQGVPERWQRRPAAGRPA